MQTLLRAGSISLPITQQIKAVRKRSDFLKQTTNNEVKTILQGEQSPGHKPLGLVEDAREHRSLLWPADMQG